MGRFRDALTGPGLAGIAEVKRRSPSAGDLRPNADAVPLARAFEQAGAAAVSILVDERFAGSVADLRAARTATPIPLLAKGFFSTRSQLEELRSAGADAVLLLLRDLDDDTVVALLGAARELGLDALVEAHDAAELERAVALDADVIGVNARDLSTFTIDRAAQLRLVAQAPPDRVVVAESGVESRAQGAAAELAGADAILVGSALMRAPEPAMECSFATARRSRASSTSRGSRRIPTTGAGRAPSTAGSFSPAVSDPRTCARRSSRWGHGASTRAAVSSPSPGLRITRACART